MLFWTERCPARRPIAGSRLFRPTNAEFAIVTAVGLRRGLVLLALVPTKFRDQCVELGFYRAVFVGQLWRAELFQVLHVGQLL